MCVVLVLAITHRYADKNPATFYSMVFVVFTAIGVSWTRSTLGITESLASRYRIYSNLMVIFCYIFLSETFRERLSIRLRPLNRTLWAGTFLFACAMFCALSDRAGYTLLKGRRDAVRYEMQRFMHGVAPADLNLKDDQVIARHLASGLYRPDGNVLKDSSELGTYRVSAGEY
jgi:hypothetical protein